MEILTEEKAASMLSEGFHCAQCVLGYGAEILQLNKDFLMRLGSGLGGGCHYGGTCGAVSGAVICLGLRYGFGQDFDTERDTMLMRKLDLFQEKFLQQQVSLTCRELLCGYDITSADGRQKIEELHLSNVCAKACACACQILKEML